MTPMRVLMVGAGRRVQNNFLPVLRALSDRFEVVGVHARTMATLRPVADCWGLPIVETLTGPELLTADVVAISVPTAQNSVVLKQLLPQAARLSLVIDTPIAWNPRELAATAPLLTQFKQVLVTEDYMNFPPFALLRQAVAKGLIGKPTAITLNNIGYLYHGLALIRSFVAFRRATRTWRRKIGSTARVVGYEFDDGYKACVIGPYRRRIAGGLVLEGTKGVVSQFADDLDTSSQSRPVYLLAPSYSDGHLAGYSIQAGASSLELFPTELISMRDMPFSDKSELNLQRGCGLASVFRSLCGATDEATMQLNLAYGPENAFYDSFVSRLAERGHLPVDPLTWIGRDAMSALHALSRFRN